MRSIHVAQIPLPTNSWRTAFGQSAARLPLPMRGKIGPRCLAECAGICEGPAFTIGTKMTRKALSAIIALVTLTVGHPPVRAYTLHYADSAGIVARRWLARPIIVAFSTSLSAPPQNI